MLARDIIAETSKTETSVKCQDAKEDSTSKTKNQDNVSVPLIVTVPIIVIITSKN